MSTKLAGKIALVTGGTTGIGLAIAKRFASEGATVYITGRRQAQLDAAVDAIGHGATGVSVDSAKQTELQTLFDRIQSEHGRLDVLVANAGGGSMVPLGQITEEHFDDTFGRNVKGTLFTVQTGLPLMKAGGSIIMTASTAGSSGTPAFSVYAASKAAVRAFARNWILDLKDSGIRVNTISPGPIKTPGLVELVGTDPAAQQGFLDVLAKDIPLGRVGEPDEVAKAAVFLASDDSSFVNGIELFVDGGMAQI
jgi:NAD(P)-dependent dehydrogenase (short-subunit alcohol dehydrogenase family)